MNKIINIFIIFFVWVPFISHSQSRIELNHSGKTIYENCYFERKCTKDTLKYLVEFILNKKRKYELKNLRNNLKMDIAILINRSYCHYGNSLKNISGKNLLLELVYSSSIDEINDGEVTFDLIDEKGNTVQVRLFIKTFFEYFSLKELESNDTTIINKGNCNDSLDLAFPNFGTTTCIKIYNNDREELKNQCFSSMQICELNLTNLLEGIYYIEFIGEFNKYNKFFLIEG